MANWYYAVGGQTQGPVDEEQLRGMARAGTLTPASYVIREGETVWQSLGDVEVGLGLARNPWGSYADAAASPPPAAAPSPPVPSEPYSTTAGGPAPTGAAQSWAEVGATPTGAPTGWGDQAAPTPTGAPSGWPEPGAAGPAWSQPTNAPPTWSTGPTGWGYPGAQPYPGMQWGAVPGQGYGPNGERLAEWWQRFVAKIIDLFIVAIPGVILAMLIAWGQIRDQLDQGDSNFRVTVGGGRGFAGEFVWGTIGLIYFAVLNGRGQTLGKKALGIRVVRVDNGQSIGTGKGVARHAVQFVAFFLWCIGLIFILVDSLWPLWDKPQRQALHDKIAGSIVVTAR